MTEPEDPHKHLWHAMSNWSAAAAGLRRTRTALGLRLRNYFFTGILVTAPLGITAYLAYTFVNFVDRQIIPLFPERYNPVDFFPFGMPGIGLVTVVLGLTMIGAITAGLVGRMFLGASESLLHRMPVIRGIYGATKQIVETLFSRQSTSFRAVVMVEFPRKNIWALGFVTGVTEGEVQRLTEAEVVNVFIPTTPNPTSGYLVFVPRDEIVELAMSVEDGIKMIVTAGIATPKH